MICVCWTSRGRLKIAKRRRANEVGAENPGWVGDYGGVVRQATAREKISLKEETVSDLSGA